MTTFFNQVIVLKTIVFIGFLYAGHASADGVSETQLVLNALKSEFPYATAGWNGKIQPAPGSYAACVNGIQPVVTFTDDSKATKGNNAYTVTLAGKLVVYDCKKADLPAAFKKWDFVKTLSGPNDGVASAWEQATGAAGGVPRIEVYDSILAGIKHEEVFQIDLTLVPTGGSSAAKVTTTSVSAYNPSGKVFVGMTSDANNQNNNAVVYGKMFPKEIPLQ